MDDTQRGTRRLIRPPFSLELCQANEECSSVQFSSVQFYSWRKRIRALKTHLLDGQKLNNRWTLNNRRHHRGSKSKLGIGMDSTMGSTGNHLQYEYYCISSSRPSVSRYNADIVLRPLISRDGSTGSTVDRLLEPSDCMLDSSKAAGFPNGLLDSDIEKTRRTKIRSCDCHRIRSSSKSSLSWTWSWIRVVAVTMLMILSFSNLLHIAQCQSVLGDGMQSSATAAANATSTIEVTRNLKSDQHQQNRKGRHTAVHPRSRHLITGDGRNQRASEDGQENQHHQRLSKAALRQLSRLAFKALISDDFEDRPLRPPVDDEDGTGKLANADDLTVEGRRQFRRQQRKMERERERQLKRKKKEEQEEEEGDLLPPASDYNQGELIDQADQSLEKDGQRERRRLPGRRRAIAIATKDSIKPDSCRTVPLKQRVRMDGCVTKIMVNNFCYGQCNSFYIPKLSKNRLRPAFESCSVCRPRIYVPMTVTLHCPSRNPPYVKRKIMKVKECSCMPAHISDNDIPPL